jgi:putative transposase
MTQTYVSLIAGGVSTRHAAVLTAMVRSTAARRRNAATALTPAVPAQPAPDPVNKLTDLERRRVLDVLNSDRFVDLAPLQIYAQLLDEGAYLCSVSTMYRVLRENTLVAERRRLARHPAKVCPELVATAPRQVYSWDITKLAGPVNGNYFDAYVMIDIYSRYIVGVEVHAHESGVLAKELMEQVFKVHGVPQVVHADRGTSMTSKTVAALLADLEVTRSHSRPRVSNDNPYSESLFKTLKYGPEFPERFGSLCQARQFMDTFTNWFGYAGDLGVSGIGPSDRRGCLFPEVVGRVRSMPGRCDAGRRRATLGASVARRLSGDGGCSFSSEYGTGRRIRPEGVLHGGGQGPRGGHRCGCAVVHPGAAAAASRR